MMLAVTALMADAESLYLHIQDTDNNWNVISLDQAASLTFNNGGMQVLDAAGAKLKEYDTKKLVGMAVNEYPTTESSIRDITSDVPQAQFELKDRSLRILQDTRVTIYNPQGKCMVDIPAVKSGQTVNLAALSPDVYIVTLNGKSHKILLR